MIFFLIPVFNEAANLKNLFAELSSKTQSASVHFVFSDDGSSDNSTEVIRTLFNGLQHTVLGDGINRGPGAAFETGFNWVLEHATDGDTVVTLEADCTSDLGILDVMLQLNRSGYDLVLASVYAQGGGFERTTFFRKLVSASANFLFRFLFDVKVLTLSSFYRVYDVGLLRRIREKHGSLITERGFVCMLEILVRAIRCKANIIEVPMKLHSSKRIGPSNMKIIRTTFHYFRYLFRSKK